MSNNGNKDPDLRENQVPNPHFFDDPNTDRLITMVMELASEVSVMRDRMDTQERLLSRKGIIEQADMENLSLTNEELKAREDWRSRFLDRILKALYTKYDSN